MLSQGTLIPFVLSFFVILSGCFSETTPSSEPIFQPDAPPIEQPPGSVSVEGSSEEDMLRALCDPPAIEPEGGVYQCGEYYKRVNGCCDRGIQYFDALGTVVASCGGFTGDMSGCQTMPGCESFNLCRLVGFGCMTDADCDSGFLCDVEKGECYTAECDSDDDCPEGEICFMFLGVEVPHCAPCTQENGCSL